MVKKFGLCQTAWMPEDDTNVAKTLSGQGFSFIDAIPSKYGKSNELELKATKGIFRDSQIQIRSVQGFMFNSGVTIGVDSQDSFEAIISKALAMGRSIGDPQFLILGAPASRPLDESNRIVSFIHSINAAARMTSRLGATLLLETLPKRYSSLALGHPKSLIAHMSSLDEKLGICLDIGNLATFNEPLDTLLDWTLRLLNTGRVLHFQFNVPQEKEDLDRGLALVSQFPGDIEFLSLESHSILEALSLGVKLKSSR